MLILDGEEKVISVVKSVEIYNHCDRADWTIGGLLLCTQVSCTFSLTLITRTGCQMTAKLRSNVQYYRIISLNMIAKHHSLMCAKDIVSQYLRTLMHNSRPTL